MRPAKGKQDEFTFACPRRYGAMMRKLIILGAVALGACIPRSDPPPEPTPPVHAQPPAGEQVTRQCQVDLAREGVQFRALPDRRFDNGCSAIGAVQLTDIGTPTANLGAMTCPVARQYARWVRDAVQPAASQILGAGVSRIETFGTYACRTVNSQPGARISEHGYANAVDIAAFVLRDGRRVTVEHGWNGEDERVRRFLRAVHRGGCQRFRVGLGPDSDALHYNHLHFDMGRSGTCR
jgi:hypothetical protein